MTIEEPQINQKLRWENEETFNSKCPDFDQELGVCGYQRNDWKACRKESCPKVE